MGRTFILLLDSLGIGATPDAERFGDAGADTLGHIAAGCVATRGALRIPNLLALGLGHAHLLATDPPLAGLSLPDRTTGAYGAAAELSTGKDTPSGHWELAGAPVLFEWGYFRDREQSFPPALLAALIEQGGLPGLLGNCHASGTEILERLGEEHLRTGKPIVYTSADSVFQIACHEQHFGLARLYALCELARRLLEPYNIGRVIARPFVGAGRGQFQRTGNRHDYALAPPMPTLLDRLVASGHEVIAIGKIADIYAGRGISRALRATGLPALWECTLQQAADAPDGALVFTNFVDFDSAYGHRRDLAGYAGALEYFDSRLPELLARLAADDWLLLTADHGCDPIWPGTEHTREQVPVLVYGAGLAAVSLGLRRSFADIGQTLAQHYGLSPLAHGDSFLPLLCPHEESST